MRYEIMKMYEIPSKYFYGGFWLLAGLIGIFLLGKFLLYDEISKNYWTVTPAVITESQIQERVGSKRNQIDQHLVLVWKYKMKENEYSGRKEIKLHDNNRWLGKALARNKKVNVFVNPDLPSESALYNWNSLATGAKAMRIVRWVLGFVAAGFGIYLLHKPAKKPKFPVYYFDSTFSFQKYLFWPVSCIFFFIIIALLARFVHVAFCLPGFVFVFVFPFFVINFLKTKGPKAEFFVSCSNPRCFSSRIDQRNHAVIIVKDNCPACNAPLNIKRIIPKHQIEFLTLPELKKVSAEDYFQIFFLVGWVLLLIPFALYLQPPNTIVPDNVKYSNILLICVWIFTGIFFTAVFSSLLRKKQKPVPITCPVCRTRIAFRRNMMLLRNTGNCPNCGAKIVKMEKNDE